MQMEEMPPHWAFPAYAGMNRGLLCGTAAAPSVPRVCGDEPKLQYARTLRELRSPRMRG